MKRLSKLTSAMMDMASKRSNGEKLGYARGTSGFLGCESEWPFWADSAKCKANVARERGCASSSPESVCASTDDHAGRVARASGVCAERGCAGYAPRGE